MLKTIFLITLMTMATSAEASGSWETLFDGNGVEAWRGFRQPDFPTQGWVVENGSLCHIAGVSTGDLITRKEYSNFELVLEWAISEGGNSGVLYRVSENEPASWHTGPEMQILDDLHHPNGQNPLTSAGSLYELIAPQEKFLAPVGEFNQARLLVSGNHVEHWLNGKRLVEYDLNSDSWNWLVANSKFKDYPSYGRYAYGHIALQEHWDGVCFRNIAIRELY